VGIFALDFKRFSEFCGIFIDPQGQIHETLLVAFGETATFAGALSGIDYVYKKRS
jgi:hypothetical protein